MKLQTIEWFTESKCDEEQVVTINTFNMKLKKWKYPMEIPDKYRNYHNCTLKVFSDIFQINILNGISSTYPHLISLFPENLVNLLDYFTEKRDVFEQNFIQVFAEQGNFSIDLTKNKSG